MEPDKKLEKNNIEKVFRDNFIKLMPSFYEMESHFLSGVYKRYGDLEGGNIVIYFARDLHLQILRKRQDDLNFDLSLENFWNNHKNILQNRKKIIFVSKETGLPKETTRRKIIDLMKQKHIKKNDKNKMFWEPSSEHKDTYVSIISDQINALSKFIFEQLKILNINSSLNRIEKEIKNNYSFYWYHYLNVQLEYIKFWQEKLKDLEMLLIGLQVIIQTLNFIKKKPDNFLSLINEDKNVNNFKLNEANISATSVSDITGIPRATCIRKLEKFVKMKILEKDSKTKRYSLIFNQTTFNPMLQPDWMKRKISILSNFSTTVLSSLIR